MNEERLRNTNSTSCNSVRNPRNAQYFTITGQRQVGMRLVISKSRRPLRGRSPCISMDSNDDEDIYIPIHLPCRQFPCKFASLKVLLLSFLSLFGLLTCLLILGSTDQESVDIQVSHHLPPCGDVCNYKGVYYPGKYYPLVWKEINCVNIMHRMAWKDHVIEYPPPRSPPADLYSEFIQNGDCPIQMDMYMVGFNPHDDTVIYKFTQPEIDDLVERDRSGKHVNIYEDNELVSLTLKEYRGWMAGRKGFVIGTERPWLEAIMLHHNASHVTTLEYRKMVFQHPRISVLSPYDFADKYLKDEVTLFDFGASYSSIEHSGLGRYGDPLNPYGDLEAMAQAWCILKPGGLFFLGVPTSLEGSCNIRWNAHRVYGYKRLQHLTANWNVLDIRQGSDADHQSVIVLSKPLLQ